MVSDMANQMELSGNPQGDQNHVLTATLPRESDTVNQKSAAEKDIFPASVPPKHRISKNHLDPLHPINHLLMILNVTNEKDVDLNHRLHKSKNNHRKTHM